MYIIVYLLPSSVAISLPFFFREAFLRVPGFKEDALVRGVVCAPGFKDPHSIKLAVVIRDLMFLLSRGSLITLSTFTLEVPVIGVRTWPTAIPKELNKDVEKS